MARQMGKRRFPGAAVAYHENDCHLFEEHLMFACAAREIRCHALICRTGLPQLHYNLSFAAPIARSALCTAAAGRVNVFVNVLVILREQRGLGVGASIFAKDVSCMFHPPIKVATHFR